MRGDFTTIGGQARNGLAALDAATGAATAWNPDANWTVGTLAVAGDTVYAGGAFTAIGGQARSGNIAALDATTGTATAWNPSADGGGVSTLALSGDTVYVGGGFTAIGGQARNRLAALNAGHWRSPPPGIRTLIVRFRPWVSRVTRYIRGGSFTQIGNGTGASVFAALPAAHYTTTTAITNVAGDPVSAVGFNAITVKRATTSPRGRARPTANATVRLWFRATLTVAGGNCMPRDTSPSDHPDCHLCRRHRFARRTEPTPQHPRRLR